MDQVQFPGYVYIAMNKISSDDNQIVVAGELTAGSNANYFLATLDSMIKKTGYSDIIIDFSRCSAAFAGAMLGICVQLMAYREAGIAITLRLPDDRKLHRLFKNSNWAHWIDPQVFDRSTFRGHTQVPAIHYRDSREQHSAVNQIVNAILGAVPDLHREDFAAFEWSINEITDNVLVHANSTVGGLVQLSTFQRNRKVVQYVVADPGIGIPATLRAAHPEITSDTDALDKAIREGVTSDRSLGQGNGLYGSYQVCNHCHGAFNIHSGHSLLRLDSQQRLSITDSPHPYKGTLIVAEIDFSNSGLLQEALRFGGKKYTPVDFLETHYEGEADDNLTFMMTAESESFGSRLAGTPIRTRLINLYQMSGKQKIIVDFSSVPLVSSSFADEVFGKLFTEIGPMAFMEKFELRNATDTINQLIDRAIKQRMVTGT